jgi:hypothetical protein
VTERSQSDLPVEMTTCAMLSDKTHITFLPHYCSEEDELVGGRASRIPAYQKSCLSSMKFFPDTPRVLWRPYYARPRVDERVYLPSSQGLGQFLQSLNDTGTPAASSATCVCSGSSVGLRRTAASRLRRFIVSGGELERASTAHHHSERIKLSAVHGYYRSEVHPRYTNIYKSESSELILTPIPKQKV